MGTEHVKFVVQATLAGLAIALVALIAFPELAGRTPHATPQSPLQSTPPAVSGLGAGPVSYAEAVARAAPAVANIYVDKRDSSASSLSDSLFRRYLGESAEGREQSDSSNLGSAVILSSEGYLLTYILLIQNVVKIHGVQQYGRESQS